MNQDWAYKVKEMTKEFERIEKETRQIKLV